MIRLEQHGQIIDNAMADTIAHDIGCNLLAKGFVFDKLEFEANDIGDHGSIVMVMLNDQIIGHVLLELKYTQQSGVSLDYWFNMDTIDINEIIGGDDGEE